MCDPGNGNGNENGSEDGDGDCEEVGMASVDIRKVYALMFENDYLWFDYHFECSRMFKKLPYVYLTVDCNRK